MSKWKIEWNDKTWTEDDVTVGHLAAVVVVNGVDEWDQLNPMAGPSKLITMLGVLVASDEGRPVNDVLAELAAAPAKQLLNALSVYEEPAAGTAPPPTKPRSRSRQR